MVESSSLVSVLFREAFSHPYISFSFHLLGERSEPHTKVRSLGNLIGLLFCSVSPTPPPPFFGVFENSNLLTYMNELARLVMQLFF